MDGASELLSLGFFDKKNKQQKHEGNEKKTGKKNENRLKKHTHTQNTHQCDDLLAAPSRLQERADAEAAVLLERR